LNYDVYTTVEQLESDDMSSNKYLKSWKGLKLKEHGAKQPFGRSFNVY